MNYNKGKLRIYQKLIGIFRTECAAGHVRLRRGAGLGGSSRTLVKAVSREEDLTSLRAG